MSEITLRPNRGLIARVLNMRLINLVKKGTQRVLFSRGERIHQFPISLGVQRLELPHDRFSRVGDSKDVGSPILRVRLLDDQASMRKCVGEHSHSWCVYTKSLCSNALYYLPTASENLKDPDLSWSKIYRSQVLFIDLATDDGQPMEQESTPSLGRC